MSTPHPRLSVDGHVARVVLDRPERHNSLGASDLAAFREHLATVEADASIRVLVLTGSGEATFCSGASLDQIASGEMSGRIFETLTADLAASRVPTVCALNGSVYGGGTEIALCCDFRIGVRGTRMSVPAARLGICYPASGLRRFVDAIGPAATRRVMLAGDELDAEEMLATGFVDRLVAREDLDAATDALARRLAALAPLAIQAMKRILRGIATDQLDDAEVEELVRRCETSEDLAEGLLARREGRAPQFGGR
jgi:enoyl-CoA hydratase/carnithine racemase